MTSEKDKQLLKDLLQQKIKEVSALNKEEGMSDFAATGRTIVLIMKAAAKKYKQETPEMMEIINKIEQVVLAQEVKDEIEKRQ